MKQVPTVCLISTGTEPEQSCMRLCFGICLDEKLEFWILCPGTQQLLGLFADLVNLNKNILKEA